MAIADQYWLEYNASYFTHSERTVKKYTVKQAIDAARFVLKDKYKIVRWCADKLKDLRLNDENTPITLVDLNYISSQIVDDTLYHEGKWA